MKRYLNSDNLVNLAIIGYMTGVLASFRKNMDKQDWSSDSKKSVSMAATWIEKAYYDICSQLDQKQAKTLINRLQSWKGAKLDIIRPTIIPKKEVVMQELEKDDWYDVIEHCMTGACQNCKLTGKQANDCRIKEIFLRYDVPVYDDTAQDGVCPYKYHAIGQVSGF